ncbi:uncharacterized protein LOC143917318 [Arctopsyche grandis]|uniref:uncharacterized protein LOC143917318 n=1 Tax=Arctopsyche grandis TaxID=121162 RepID=UPI00406D6A5A
MNTFLFSILPVFCADSSDRGNVLKSLPVEIVCLIFRMLDGRSLYTASTADSYFAEIIKGDRTLRRKLRRHINIAKLDPLNVKRLETTNGKRKRKFDEPIKKANFSAKTFSANGVQERPAKRQRLDDIICNVNKKMKLYRF